LNCATNAVPTASSACWAARIHMRLPAIDQRRPCIQPHPFQVLARVTVGNQMVSADTTLTVFMGVAHHVFLSHRFNLSLHFKDPHCTCGGLMTRRGCACQGVLLATFLSEDWSHGSVWYQVSWVYQHKQRNSYSSTIKMQEVLDTYLKGQFIS
jgi:hypothetical protein